VTKDPRPDDTASWDLPDRDDPEPEWAEEIRKRRKARGERYEEQMADARGERAEPPVGDP
jgi:hypothetical protein